MIDSRWTYLVSVGLALLGVAYLLTKSVLSSESAVDFPYVWLAGYVWNSGVDPYSAAFNETAQRLFSHTHAPETWFYPPSWWALSSAFALADYDTALWVWRSSSAAMLVAGVFLIALGLRKIGRPPSPSLVWLTLAWACLFSGTATSLGMGQTSLLSYFGCCLFVYGVLTGNRPVLVVALMVLMLKPQVGLPFCAFLLPWRRFWPPLFIAGGLSILMAIPALYLSGLPNFIATYLDQLAHHATLVANRPHETTGIRTLVWSLSQGVLEPLVLTAAGAIGGVALGLMAARRDVDLPRMLAALVAFVAFVMPLHFYDLTLIAPVILLATGVRAAAGWVIAAGFLLMLRANNIANATGLHDPATLLNTGSLLGTVGVLLIMIGVGMAFGSTSTARQGETRNRAA